MNNNNKKKIMVNKLLYSSEKPLTIETLSSGA